MITQSSLEQKLKDLIEGRAVGHHNDFGKANLEYRAYSAKFGGISYDEAIQLVKENNDTLKHMSVHDPAFMFLVQSRNEMLKWAGVQNNTLTLGRHDHEYPVHALVSVDGVTVECHFYIPQLYYLERDRERSIRNELKLMIVRSSDWSGGFRNPSKIDFVEL